MRKLTKISTIAVMTAAATLIGSSTLVRAADADEGTAKEQHGQWSKKDYKFAHDATEGNLLEVKLGELAKQRAANPSVQQFADQMIQDHTKANMEFKQLAMQKGATIPDKLSHHQESEFEHMQKLSGKDFDKKYAEHTVKDHKKDVKEFQDASKDIQDPELKAFAQKTLPILEHHTQMAEQMESSLKQAEP